MITDSDRDRMTELNIAADEAERLEAELKICRAQRDRLLKAMKLLLDDAQEVNGETCACMARAPDDLTEPPPCVYCIAGDAIAYAESQGSEMDKTALLGEQQKRLLEVCKQLLNDLRDAREAHDEACDNIDEHCLTPYRSEQEARDAIALAENKNPASQ